jgi:rhodanese-related sulfurtransferase
LVRGHADGRGSFARGHVPGSINLHTEELNDYETRLRTTARTYLVVVAARGRSGPAVRAVRISTTLLPHAHVTLMGT